MNRTYDNVLIQRRQLNAFLKADRSEISKSTHQKVCAFTYAFVLSSTKRVLVSFVLW